MVLPQLAKYVAYKSFSTENPLIAHTTVTNMHIPRTFKLSPNDERLRSTFMRVFHGGLSVLTVSLLDIGRRQEAHGYRFNDLRCHAYTRLSLQPTSPSVQLVFHIDQQL